jgi:hypothetical protein
LYLLYQQEKIITNNFKFLIIKAEDKLVKEKGIHRISFGNYILKTLCTASVDSLITRFKKVLVNRITIINQLTIGIVYFKKVR